MPIRRNFLIRTDDAKLTEIRQALVNGKVKVVSIIELYKEDLPGGPPPASPKAPAPAASEPKPPAPAASEQKPPAPPQASSPAEPPQQGTGSSEPKPS